MMHIEAKPADSRTGLIGLNEVSLGLTDLIGLVLDDQPGQETYQRFYYAKQYTGWISEPSFQHGRYIYGIDCGKIL